MHKLILTLCLVVNVVIGASSNFPQTTLPVLIYGKDGDAIEVVEFCSMYCPACEHFKDTTFKEIEHTYIHSGQLRWTRILFPIDYGDVLMLAYMKHLPTDQLEHAYEWYQAFREKAAFSNEDEFQTHLVVGLKEQFPTLNTIQKISPLEIDKVVQETIRLAERYQLTHYPTLLVDGQRVSVTRLNDFIANTLKRRKEQER